MNKLSITNLEKARVNPSKYANDMKNGDLSVSFGGGRAKSLRWHDAVLLYHETGDITKATLKLEQSFSNRKNTPKNRRELEDLIIALDTYVNEHNNKGYIHIDKRVSIVKQLSPQLLISGWVCWLLNMKSNGGYAGYVITKDVDEINWMLELRFPIIQEYIANTLYGCKIEEVDVGIIDYTTGNHYSICFSQEDIDEAEKELNEMGSIFNNILDG